MSTVRVDDSYFHPLLPLWGSRGWIAVWEWYGACAFRSRDHGCVKMIRSLSCERKDRYLHAKFSCSTNRHSKDTPECEWIGY